MDDVELELAQERRSDRTSVALYMEALRGALDDAGLTIADVDGYWGQFPAGNTMVFGLETPFTEPHDFLFQMHNPKGIRNHAGVNDPPVTLTTLLISA